MGNILLIAEHDGQTIKKSTFQALSLARQLADRHGSSVDIACIGTETAGLVAALQGYGAGRILTVESAALANFLAQPWAAAIAGVATQTGATAVVCSAGTFGKDVLPRVAGSLGWGMVADCIGLTDAGGGLAYQRPMYAGNIVASVRVTTPGAVISVRGSEFDIAGATGADSEVTPLTVELGQCGARFVSFEGTKSERPELTEADVVVSGGRGLKDGDNFYSVMEPLADSLGAAIGASRAAVDSGFCPNDFQVGQTGKVVAPKLYVAVALSGAIQHLAGMKNSKTIVAINKDPEAPIFQLTDYGLIADAFSAVPELADKLSSRS